MRDASGNALVMPDGSAVGSNANVGGVFPHWYAREAAIGWIAEARRRIDAVSANRNAGADTFQGMTDALKALMNAYNALNIPWVVDPAARALYRRYIAGNPAGPNAVSSEFGPRNYNSSFSIQNYYRVQTEVSFEGSIPRAGRAVFNQCMTDPANAGRHPGQFLQTFEPRVDVAQAYAGSNRENFLGLSLDPRADFTVESAPAVQNYAAANAPLGLGFCRIPGQGGGGCPSCDPGTGWAGWNTYNFDSSWVGLFGDTAPLKFASALQDYWWWFDAWQRALAARTPEQIIQDSRAYAIYLNSWSVQQNGGSIAQLLNGIGLTQQKLNSPDPQLQAAVRSVGSAIASLGALTAAGTGGMSALIGGAVAGVLSVASNYVPPDTSSIFLDDLKRAKPVFERGWLAGSPASDAPGNAPELSVPDPPAAANAWPPIAVIDPSALLSPTASTLPRSGADSANALVVGGLVLAAAGVGWYVWQDRRRRGGRRGR